MRIRIKIYVYLYFGPGATTTNFIKSSNLRDSNLFKKMKNYEWLSDKAKIWIQVSTKCEKEVIIPAIS